MLSTHDLQVGTEHELVRVVRDPGTGLLAIIAVHSTALGPAMGGVRRRGYASLDDAVGDALRLSQAMTLKSAAAGLPLGGGKSVIVDSGAELSPSALDAFADAIESLAGDYVAAEDIGTTPSHMDHLSRRTRWVAGQSARAGGNGDPSPATALTVFGAMVSGAAVRWGTESLRARRVGVLGVGNVGSRVAKLAADAGARVVVADTDARRAEAMASALSGVEVAHPDALLQRPLEIFAPCATGGVLTGWAARSLEVDVVCGAANNVLADDLVADQLAARGILYVPDFIANAGGIVHVGGAFLGWSEAQIVERRDRCVRLARDVLEEAKRRGCTPLAVAHERAQERLMASPAH
jgi:glutamate dehydrogenase/leucine dehydrogenase